MKKIYNYIMSRSKLRHTLGSLTLLLVFSLLSCLFVKEGIALLVGVVLTAIIGYIIEKLGVWSTEDINFDMLGIFIGSFIFIIIRELL